MTLSQGGQVSTPILPPNAGLSYQTETGKDPHAERQATTRTTNKNKNADDFIRPPAYPNHLPYHPFRARLAAWAHLLEGDVIQPVNETLGAAVISAKMLVAQVGEYGISVLLEQRHSAL